MSHAAFVHLRVHSAYSLLEGALRVPELIGLCRDARMPAVAVTDTANLFGALEFCTAAAKAGVQPIVGCLLAFDGDEQPERPEAGHGRPTPPPHLLFLVKDAAGYGNLMKLLGRAYFRGEPGEAPRVGLDDLRAHNGGLLLLTGGPDGPVGRALLQGHAGRAEALLGELAAIFEGRTYVELMRHGLEAEVRTEPAFLDLADRLGLPLVATNDVHFATADMHEAHEVLLCIADGAQFGQTDRRRLTPDHRFKTAAEMAELFEDIPEAVANTLTIARRCAFMVTARPPILPAYPTEDGRSEAGQLRAEAAAGLERRLERHVFRDGATPEEREAAARPYRERLAYELDVIEQMNYPGYFLIVSEFIRWAKDQGIPVGPGRGSGAGSVVAWAMSITDLDPLRFGLLFERFLNPDRVSMPDFDVDFCQDRRDEVIRHVREKYGDDRVAHIITFGRLQPRAVLRDVGRVMGLPYGQVDRICKLVPFNPANPPTLEQALRMEPRLEEARRSDPQIARLIDIGLRLEGLPRHASTHAAGVVIGDRPLDELVPLYRDPRSGMPVTQFNMKDVEKAGLVKFDFLGLTTLTLLRLAVDMLRARGTDLDLDRLTFDDPRAYDLLSRAETAGVFQLESGGIR
ncbi:MAG TPA: DNA polymerase III subunit alpha, partial [Geminicoccaceae bacterium]|nr:DNA polymerase III subunit alpha [Geminicoccaceae bacterium]